MRMSIVVRFRFSALHRWSGAVEPSAFLAHPHRHVFHVEAARRVHHEDREVEFIELKERCEAWAVERARAADVCGWSCETWAKEIAAVFGFYRVEVSEDGENGALVEE